MCCAVVVEGLGFTVVWLEECCVFCLCSFVFVLLFLFVSRFFSFFRMLSLIWFRLGWMCLASLRLTWLGAAWLGVSSA